MLTANKNKFIAVLLVLLVAFLGWYYSPALKGYAPKSTEMDSYSQTVIDMAGQTVRIPKNPKVVVGIHALPDTILARLQPESQKTVQPVSLVRIGVLPEQEQNRLRALPVINAFYKPTSTEVIMGVHPDIIVDLSKDPKLKSRRDEFGVPVVALSKDTIEEFIMSWHLMGKWLGKEDLANQVANGLTMELYQTTSSIQPYLNNKKRAWLANGVSGETPGPKTIMTDILRKAGAVTYWDTRTLPSVAAATDEGLVIPIDEMINFDPEYIFCNNDGTRKAIVNDPRLVNVSAVKNGHVYTQLKYLRIDEMQTVAGCRWAAQIMYPEAFVDQDIYEFASEYYKNLFDVTVSKDSPLFRELN